MNKSSKKANSDEDGYPPGMSEYLTKKYYSYPDLTEPAGLIKHKTNDCGDSMEKKDEAKPGRTETTAPKQKDKMRGTNLKSSAYLLHSNQKTDNGRYFHKEGQDQSKTHHRCSRRHARRHIHGTRAQQI
jgi:hypothetical protein